MKVAKVIKSITNVFQLGNGFVNVDGEEEKGNILIDIGNEERTVTEEWLTLFAKFRLDFLPQYKEYIPSVEFYKHKRNHKYDAYTIRFNKPVEYNSRFRVIARYPKYAVDKNGNILSIVSGKIRTAQESIDKGTTGEYPHVYMYDGRLGYSAKVYLHTLVATQWIDNVDWKNKVIVNHKDGNKFNPSSTNLEWLSYSENTIHYYEELAGTEKEYCNMDILDLLF